MKTSSTNKLKGKYYGDDSKNLVAIKDCYLRTYGNNPLQLVFRCETEEIRKSIVDFLALIGHPIFHNEVASNYLGWTYWYDSGSEHGVFLAVETEEEKQLIIKLFKETFKDNDKRRRKTKETGTKSNKVSI